MKSLRKRFHFAYRYERNPQDSILPADGIVCHGLHNPFHNTIARADALMNRRFICACSRVKRTTETKNSASKVIRAAINSSLRPKASLILVGGGKRPGGHLPRRFGKEGLARVAWGKSRRIFVPADADARKHGGIRHS